MFRSYKGTWDYTKNNIEKFIAANNNLSENESFILFAFGTAFGVLIENIGIVWNQESQACEIVIYSLDEDDTTYIYDDSIDIEEYMITGNKVELTLFSSLYSSLSFTYKK